MFEGGDTICDIRAKEFFYSIEKGSHVDLRSHKLKDGDLLEKKQYLVFSEE